MATGNINRPSASLRPSKKRCEAIDLCNHTREKRNCFGTRAMMNAGHAFLRPLVSFHAKKTAISRWPSVPKYEYGIVKLEHDEFTFTMLYSYFASNLMAPRNRFAIPCQAILL